MPALASPHTATLLTRFAEPLRRQLAQQVLHHDKAKVETILRLVKLHKVWAGQPLAQRQNLLATYAGFDPALCRLLLQGWLKRSEPLR